MGWGQVIQVEPISRLLNLLPAIALSAFVHIAVFDNPSIVASPSPGQKARGTDFPSHFHDNPFDKAVL